MRSLTAGLRHELVVSRRSPGELTWLVVSPLYTAIFLTIVEHAGRSDLASYAVLGPAVMALIGTAMYNAGEFIDTDRAEGILEMEIAAPSSFPMVIAGRTLAVISLGSLTVGEAWLVAGLGFGRWIAIPHPWVFAATLALTVASTAGIATVMAAVFVLARSARIFQNSLSFPLFVLGGAFVPVSFLPGWLTPLARLVYLSWASDLLRDSTRPGPVTQLWWRWAALVALGTASFLLGAHLLDRIVRRVRALGTLAYS